MPKRRSRRQIPAFLGDYRRLPPPLRPRRAISLELGGAFRAASGQVKGLRMETQAHTYWCWAAVASSIARKYDPQSSWSQCRVATSFYASKGKVRPCCTEGGRCDEPQILSEVFAITGNLAQRLGKVAFETVVSEIDADRPVAVRIGWPPRLENGHFIVLTGYRVTEAGEEFVRLRDPVDGPDDVKEISFTALVSDFDQRFASDNGRWTHTYRTRP